MIKVVINGGLGNQMFQYAVGRAAALRNKTNLKLDVSWYEYTGKNTKRNFELDKFNIKAKTFGKGLAALINKILVKLRLIKMFYEKEIYKFDDSFFTSKNIYLNGFWQNEYYFKDYINVIRKDFYIKGELSKNFLLLKNKTENSESVAVHIRRGDYVVNQETNNFHGTCSLDYYKQSISLIKERIAKPCFYIFSDDINWVKSNLRLSNDVVWISDYKINDVEELILLSLCKHQIIANSSFSWWGAYLNENPEKIVIAPQRWINDDRYNTSNMTPSSWIKI